MKRIVFAVLVSSALLAASPATTLAQEHHSRHHHHHARIRHEHWGANERDQSATSTDNAGTVKSFTAGVLTITLTDGSTVSGRVTDATETECTGPSQNVQREDGGGDQRSGDDSSGDNGSGDNGSGDDQNGGDQGDDNGDNGQTCTTSAMTPGTVVHEAELEVSSAGAIWQKLELGSSSES